MDNAAILKYGAVEESVHRVNTNTAGCMSFPGKFAGDLRSRDSLGLINLALEIFR